MRRERAAVFVVALLYAAWAIYYVQRTALTLHGERVYVLWDDAMVSMRYARNFAAGRGLVWNPGERIQGFSNLGLTLIMAALHRLPLGPTRVSVAFQALCLAALLGTIAFVRALATTVLGDRRLGNLAAVLAMCSAPLAVLSLQGTDVGFVTFFVVGALALAAKELPDRPPPIAAYLLLALGVVVRLDVAIVYTVLLAAALVVKRDARVVLLPAALLALTVGAVLAFGAVYYGDPLPNTYYLKATGCPRGLVLASGLGQLVTLVRRVLPPLVVIAIGWRLFFRRDRRMALLGVTGAALVAYDVWVGGDWVWEWTSRFVAPVLPILIVLFVGTLARLVDALALAREEKGDGEAARGETTFLRPSPERRFDLTVLGALLAIPAFGTEPALLEWLNPNQPTMYWRENEESLKVADYLRAHVDPDTSVAVHWAGIVPYFTELPAIDVLGKCDAHIAHLTVDHFAPGHSKWDWAYVVGDRRPDIIDYADRGLGAREDFRASYDAVCLPEQDQPTFYLRREARAKLHDPDARLLPITAGLRCR